VFHNLLVINKSSLESFVEIFVKGYWETGDENYVGIEKNRKLIKKLLLLLLRRWNFKKGAFLNFSPIPFLIEIRKGPRSRLSLIIRDLFFHFSKKLRKFFFES
jgi:hypothetical protein